MIFYFVLFPKKPGQWLMKIYNKVANELIQTNFVTGGNMELLFSYLMLTAISKSLHFLSKSSWERTFPIQERGCVGGDDQTVWNLEIMNKKIWASFKNCLVKWSKFDPKINPKKYQIFSIHWFYFFLPHC